MSGFVVLHRYRYPSGDSSAPYGRAISEQYCATLDETREAARKLVNAREPFGGAPYGEWAHLAAVASELPERGGTVDLPDATQILVKPASLCEGDR